MPPPATAATKLSDASSVVPLPSIAVMVEHPKDLVRRGYDALSQRYDEAYASNTSTDLVSPN
jgi:hypothetical protein